MYWLGFDIFLKLIYSYISFSRTVHLLNVKQKMYYSSIKYQIIVNSLILKKKTKKTLTDLLHRRRHHISLDLKVYLKKEHTWRTSKYPFSKTPWGSRCCSRMDMFSSVIPVDTVTHWSWRPGTRIPHEWAWPWHTHRPPTLMSLML